MPEQVTDLTSSNRADPGYGSYNFCTGQCWYDNFVVSPAGYPDIVYLGGSYQYGETGNVSNGRAVVLSTDAGVSFTDMTMDGTDPIHQIIHSSFLSRTTAASCDPVANSQMHRPGVHLAELLAQG